MLKTFDKSGKQPLRKNQIPYYVRIKSLLRNKILSGQYAPSEKLPTEEELLRYFGVSKITIRNALSLLESEGLITRNAGKGTFVAEQIPITKQFIFTGGVHNIVLDAERYEVSVLGIQRLKVAETRSAKNIRAFFGLGNNDEITCVQRIRLLKGIPIYFIENNMLLEIGKHLTVKELSHRPLLRILRERIGLVIGQAEMYIEAIPSEPDIAELLQIQTFDPLIFLQVYYRFSDGNPFEIVNCLMKADYFKYKINLDAEGFDNI
jgi:GntR family transcriptional regulator